MSEGPARDATSNEEYRTPSDLGRRPSGNTFGPRSGPGHPRSEDYREPRSWGREFEDLIVRFPLKVRSSVCNPRKGTNWKPLPRGAAFTAC